MDSSVSNTMIRFTCKKECNKKDTEMCFGLECIKGQESLLEQYSQYKNTLMDVKEMIETLMETNNVYPLQVNLSKILQKIKEVSE